MKSIIKHSVIVAALVVLPLPALAAPGSHGAPGNRPGIQAPAVPGAHKEQPNKKPEVHHKKHDNKKHHNKSGANKHQPDKKPGAHHGGRADHAPQPGVHHEPPPRKGGNLLQRSLLRWFGW